jgi:hypothetical protein
MISNAAEFEALAIVISLKFGFVRIVVYLKKGVVYG